MPNLIDIRRRIRSVKSTQQITKAMKMVAASKLRRSQERVLAARPYARTLGATHLARRTRRSRPWTARRLHRRGPCSSPTACPTLQRPG